jgi:ribosomal protein S27AE
MITSGLLPRLASPFLVGTDCPHCRQVVTAEHTHADHTARTRRFKCGQCAGIMRIRYDAAGTPGKPVAVRGRR